MSLKLLAQHLQLSPATVSLVINRSPAAKSIPQHTQERTRSAARELSYRPNFMARSLRQQRGFTISVVVPGYVGAFELPFAASREGTQGGYLTHGLVRTPRDIYYFLSGDLLAPILLV